MPKKNKSNNLNLAFLFLIVVSGLILLSIFFKLIFVVKDSKFDGNHSFILAFLAKEETDVVSFSPQNKSISILSVSSKVKQDNLSSYLEVPLDGVVKVPTNSISDKNLSSELLRLELTLGNSYSKITFIDILRLFLFARSVPANSIFQRQLLENLTSDQKSTIINLSFTNPQIYQDNQSVEIINATDTFGLGNRLANLITNIGGNVVLVQSADQNQNGSEITYFQDKSYTVNYLSNYLGFKTIQSDKRGVADVIIILGSDSLKEAKF